MTTLASTTRTWGEMIKFSHSIFALPFALVATFLASRGLPGGLPRPGQFALIVICMISARSFAMTFNRLADAAIDARNPRTAGRPIPAGRIDARSARVFLWATAAIFVLGCAGFFVLYRNALPLMLSVPTLACLAAYSYAKRFTAAAHFILGGVIGFAPAAAWIAINPASISSAPVWLTFTVLSWIAGFDIIYACQDYDVDRRDGLFSIPARVGIGPALWISRICHVVTMVCLWRLGVHISAGNLYWIGLGLTGLLLIVEQSVVRANDLSRVNLAFFTLNGCVSILFAVLAIADLLMTR